MGASIALVNPKFLRNVGEIVRAAACFGVERVVYSGLRVSLDDLSRIPRELRHKSYSKVKSENTNDVFRCGVVMTPVAVEFRPGFTSLVDFQHPEDAMYIFGPEDGSLGRQHLSRCHAFVQIPLAHCANLAAAVYMTLYDRMAKSMIEASK